MLNLKKNISIIYLQTNLAKSLWIDSSEFNSTPQNYTISKKN